MKVQFFTPSERLRPWVKEFWTWEDVDPQKLPKILPSYECELVVHISKPPAVKIDSNPSFDLPSIHWVGPQSRSWEIQSNEKLSLFSIRFYPGALYGQYSIKGIDILNQFPAFDLLVESSQDWKVDLVRKIFNEHKYSERQIENTLTSLLNSFMTKPSEIPSYLKFAMMELLRNKIPISKLSENLKISKKQLERKFKEVIGFTPIEFQKVHRLLTMIRSPQNYSQNDPNIKMVDIATYYNFVDQSHFTHQFKSMVGSVPKDWFLEFEKMSHFYKTKPNQS